MGLGGIEIGERGRDFRVLFLWSEFDPSAVDRAVKERKGRERGRERNIIKEIFFFFREREREVKGNGELSNLGEWVGRGKRTRVGWKCFGFTLSLFSLSTQNKMWREGKGEEKMWELELELGFPPLF